MTLPTYKFEIAFNAGVSTGSASRTWTDVTSYVLLAPGVDITYGRGDWRSTSDANTLRLTLNNSDGRFTAGRTASPYYPNVKLGRPIRVTATVGGTSSVRFLGFIDEWPLDWPASVGTFATAEITASSRLAWLAEGVELRSIIEEEFFNDSPIPYYTMGEAAGATQAADSSGRNMNPLLQTGTGANVTFGAATGPGTDGLTAATFSGGKYLSAYGVQPGDVECFALLTSYPASATAIIGDSLGNVRIGVDSTGALSFAGVSAGVTLALSTTYHLAISSSFSTSGYVNGTQVVTGLPGASLGSITVGALPGSPTISGVVAHVAVSVSPSAARVLAHANAGLNGFAGETPGARVTRYASYADILTGELSLDAGKVAGLTHLDTTGSTALDMMRKIETTEEGILFDQADGKLAFHDRAHRYAATSSFTLDVSQGHIGVGIQPRLDRAAIRNDVSAVSADGTVTAHVTNAASLTAYGPARESLDLATSNADEPFEHASWLVNQYAEPQPRVPQLPIDLARPSMSTALTQSILAAAISTRFTVNSMPSQAASSSQDYIVEGYSESFDGARHSITFNISQAQPYDVFTIGDPVLGQYDAYPIAL